MKFIIVGAGDVGISLSERLVHAHYEVVLIEKNETVIGTIPSHLDCQVLHGNGCSPQTLIQAGIHTGHYIVAVTDVDEVNISACLAAKLINPNMKRVARIRQLSFDHKEIQKEQLNEYFDLIINPAQAGAEYFAQLYQVPGAEDIVEFADGKLRVLGLRVTSNSPYCGCKIKELRSLEFDFPILVIAIIRDGKLIVPSGDDQIKEADLIYCITLPEQTSALFSLAGKTLKEPDSAMVWGGSSVTVPLVHYLENLGSKVKLIMNPELVDEQVVDEFSETLVLQGRGTDQDLLIEENIGNFDTFIAASENEEDNILSALLAKKLGAKVVMVLVNQRSFLRLVSAIGVDVVVSTEVAAASQIFRHIHADAVISEFTLSTRAASFIEIKAKEGMQFLDTPIKDLRFPTGTLVSAIVRGDEVIIPDGSKMVKVDDHVVLFAVNDSLKKLQKMLDINLEILE